MTKILLVEDNKFNMDALSRFLKRRGYDVVGAEDGNSALSSAGTVDPDVILMDIGLPDIDGHEVVKKLKTDEKTAEIPVIALTANAFSTDRERAIAAGCDDFDTKPVEIDRLIGKIERFTNGKVAC